MSLSRVLMVLCMLQTCIPVSGNEHGLKMRFARSLSRANSLLELASLMVPKLGQHVHDPDRLTTRDFAKGLSRIPGKGLAEKTLPMDRAIANHLKVAEGWAPASTVPVPAMKEEMEMAVDDVEMKLQHVQEDHEKDSQKLAEQKQANDQVAEKVDSSNGLFYKLYGNGPQKVVMVMGISASHAGWEYLLPLLAANGSQYQVAVFDNRGVGQSLCPDNLDQYSMEIFARDTIALADHIGWEKFHLVGFSMGGMIAQTTASLIPERLHSLALLSTSARRTISERIPPVHELPTLLYWITARSEEEKAEADLRMHFDDEYLAKEFVGGATIRDFWKSVYLSERAENQESQKWNGFKGQLSALTKFKMRKSQFARIRAGLNGPCLIMQGTKDRIIHPASGKCLHSYFTEGHFEGVAPLSQEDCQLITVAAGHFLPIQKRREVAKSLIHLWERACPPTTFVELQEEVGVPAKSFVDSVGDALRVMQQAPNAMPMFLVRGGGTILRSAGNLILRRGAQHSDVDVNVINVDVNVINENLQSLETSVPARREVGAA